MKRHLIHTLHDHIGSEILISGKIISVRDHGKMLFLDISDRSGEVQCFIHGSSPLFDEARKVSLESVVSLVGKVAERPEKNRSDGDNGDIEFTVDSLSVLSHAHELPFDIQTEVNLDTKFDYRPITLRRSEDRMIFSVQSHIVRGFREYLLSEDFVEFQAPCIVGGDAEGGAEVFSVDYFDKKASLATSPQLYKQILVGVFERVFCVGKVFRAEKHNTSRHLNEYTSLDFEMGYITDHRDVMDTLEQCMRHIVGVLAAAAGNEFKAFGADFPMLPDDSFPVVKFTEAQQILASKYNIACEGEIDFAPEHERKICEYARDAYNSDFIFVTHYPVEKRPMYVYEDENDKGFTKSFDLLFKGVEISSGGQRIHDYRTLVQKIQDKVGGDDPVERFSFYLQAFKYGMPPHGGMAVGLERFTANMLNIPNTKEAAIFPRDRGRIDTRLYE